MIKFSQLKINDILSKIKKEKAERAKLMDEKSAIQVFNYRVFFFFLKNFQKLVYDDKKRSQKQIEALMKSKGIDNGAFNEV